MENIWIVLYDGSCGFCNSWVKWILNNDSKNKFQFASLQSGFGQNFLKCNNFKTDEFDTIYIVNQKYEYKSKLDAIIEICMTLGGIYKLTIIGKALPPNFANKLYDIIATNRKKIMGENCYFPTLEERQKFIE